MFLLDIVMLMLIFIIFYFLYKYYVSKQARKYNQNQNNETFDGAPLDFVPDGEKYTDKYMNKQNESIQDFKSNISPNNNFLDMQFHTDYRDVITSFNDIAPDQKQIFNVANAPAKLSTVAYPEVKSIVTNFIASINNNIKTNVADYRTNNTGWDEPLGQLDNKTGWDGYMKELGLPTSLYNKTAKRAFITLVKMESAEKYATEYETQYIITLILQKVNTADQMIIKISFVKDNTSNNINKERTFFDDITVDFSNKTKHNNKLKDSPNMVIEEIFIIGFLTNEGLHENSALNNDKLDFYNFNGLNDSDITDNHTIAQELIHKKLEQQKEMNSFTASLSLEDKQNQHLNLPSTQDYNSNKFIKHNELYDFTE